LDYLAKVNVKMDTLMEFPETIDDLVKTLASELFRASAKPTLNAFGVLCSASVKE